MALFGAIPSQAKTVNESKIAILIPQNGTFANYGELQFRGYQLAQQHLAKEGKSPSIHYFDIGSNYGNLNQFLDSVFEWQPDVIIGPYSSDRAKQVVKYISEKEIHIPYIIPTSVLDSLTQEDTNNIFRVAAPSRVLAQTVVDFVEEMNREWNLQNIFVLHEDSIFARGAAKSITTLSEGKRIPAAKPITYKDEDLDTKIKSIKNLEKTGVIVITRSDRDAIKITNELPPSTKIIGYQTAFLTPTYHQFLAKAERDVYILNPWRSDLQDKVVLNFINDFSNLYRSEYSNSKPQYHNVQTYSTLTVATNALAVRELTQKNLIEILRGQNFETPLGNIRFSNFGGFYNQSGAGAVIQFSKDGELKTIFANKQSGSSQQSMITDKDSSTTMKEAPPFWRILLGNQVITLFCVIVLGLLFGKFSISGISFGNSGVIFVALLFGHFHLSIPSGVGTLGLILFIYAVGIGAGPSFFAAFAKQGAKFAQLSIVIGVLATLITISMAKLLHLPVDLAVGLFAGALTSTPALASSIDTLKEFGPLVPVGYGIAYPFGVIGVVLFVQLLPKILRKDLDAEASQLEEKREEGSKIVKQRIAILNSSLFGKKINECMFLEQSNCQIVGEFVNEAFKTLTPDATFEQNQHLVIVCEEKNSKLVTEYFGEIVDSESDQLTENRAVPLIVTANSCTEKSIGEMQILAKFGVTITRVLRHEVKFVPNRNTKLERFDRIEVEGPPKNIEVFAKFVGHNEKVLSKTDLFSLSVGLVVGVVIGLLPISIGGSKPISLGLAGGPLMVALILGYYGQIGVIQGRLPNATRLFMMELGLVFFLANAGIKAGGAFADTLANYGYTLFLVGACISTLPLVLGYVIATFFFKFGILETLGGLCGGMTSSPALGAIKSKTDSEIPVITYATAYPVALILMIVAAQIIIGMI